jgi:K+-sensing histidine kinase KdpD
LAKPGQDLFVSQLVNRLQTFATQQGIANLALDVPEAFYHVRLAMTPKAMDLIVGELLENAKKYHPRNAPRVEVSVTIFDDQALRLQIRDDGRPIPPERLSRIWEPYLPGEKEHPASTDSGMGLGLPLVAALVWQVGGEVSITNRRDGPGVVIAITLPVVKASATAPLSPVS